MLLQILWCCRFINPLFSKECKKLKSLFLQLLLNVGTIGVGIVCVWRFSSLEAIWELWSVLCVIPTEVTTRTPRKTLRMLQRMCIITMEKRVIARFSSLCLLSFWRPRKICTNQKQDLQFRDDWTETINVKLYLPFYFDEFEEICGGSCKTEQWMGVFLK